MSQAPLQGNVSKTRWADTALNWRVGALAPLTPTDDATVSIPRHLWAATDEPVTAWVEQGWSGHSHRVPRLASETQLIRPQPAYFSTVWGPAFSSDPVPEPRRNHLFGFIDAHFFQAGEKLYAHAGPLLQTLPDPGQGL
jgi:hypothetical protein